MITTIFNPLVYAQVIQTERRRYSRIDYILLEQAHQSKSWGLEVRAVSRRHPEPGNLPAMQKTHLWQVIFHEIMPKYALSHGFSLLLLKISNRTISLSPQEQSSAHPSTPLHGPFFLQFSAAIVWVSRTGSYRF